jgi:FkbH-like protein
VNERFRLLPWLPRPPKEFRSIVRQLGLGPSLDYALLRKLAATELDVTQLGQLGKVIARHHDEIARDGTFLPIRLGLLGSHTLEFVEAALHATALRHGLLLSLTRAPYGQFAQAVFDSGSTLIPGTLDVILLALDSRALGIERPQLNDEAALAAVDAAISQIVSLRNGIRDRLGAVVAFQTLPLPADSLFGAFDARMPGSPRSMADAFNRRLSEVLLSGDMIVDIAFAAASVGLVHWHDPRAWHGAKLPCALEAVPLYADHVCRVLGAFRGKTRKCLVLDLDNTLWGGVIGDDGLEGIVLGNGSGTGEAYAALQTVALDLRGRGIILAVCSKNDEANALLPFRRHNEMVLKEEHIACFVANWTDKAANLREIATMLNIGTDSLVFLDDNPAERAIVRMELPEVAVPEVGEDPAEYPGLFTRAGYFEALSFSNEDRLRADLYRANADRLKLQSSVTNLTDYLASLEMTMYASPFDVVGRTRITQLINKSNQFNLTSRRYSEAQIEGAEKDPKKFTLQVRLSDKFGDNGIVSVIIFDKECEKWSCDTWLMSCRVLGRRVEEAVLAVVAKAARAEGAATLQGRYIPSKKNGLVVEHFAKLNFDCIASSDDGTTDWQLELAQYEAPMLPITIECSDKKTGR